MAATNKAVALCAFADEQVRIGSIYVLGAQGETLSQITDAWIAKREHNDKNNIKRVKALLEKRIKQGYTNLRAYDCSGLIIRFLLDEKLISGDKNANGIFYDLCKEIKKADLQAGDLVFKKYATNSRMYHVGVYMGDGIVVHSKGRDVGVVRESISKESWNRYGRLKVLAQYINESEAEDVIKKGDKNQQVGAWQRALKSLGYDLGTYGTNKDGIDNEFGSKTETATKEFQKASGLPQTGIVDAATAAAMWSKLLSKAGDSAKVAELQAKINAAKMALA
jgi:hypothetical protein